MTEAGTSERGDGDNAINDYLGLGSLIPTIMGMTMGCADVGPWSMMKASVGAEWPHQDENVVWVMRNASLVRLGTTEECRSRCGAVTPGIILWWQAESWSLGLITTCYRIFLTVDSVHQLKQHLTPEAKRYTD